MKTFALFASLATLALATASQAAVVTVTDTVTGSAGAWTHNFTVTNGLPNTNDIYFFGVKMDMGNITGSPSGFDPNAWPLWNSNGFYGGSNTAYNNNWIDFTYANLLPGQSLGGFQVLDLNAVAQTNIQWFAYAYLGNYNGNDCFNCGGNPGFEGIAGNVAAVPEPATWALMIAGFGMVGATLRRRKTVAVTA